MPVETEESNVPISQPPAAPTPKKFQGPLQIGGVTAGPTSPSPVPSPKPSSSIAPAPPPSGGAFPDAPPTMAPDLPPVAPPPSPLDAFKPPSNASALLNNAGFFQGPGSLPGNQLDPTEWLRQLFGQLGR